MLPLRYICLVLLCLQNSSYTLLRRYSRGVLKETIPSSVVLVASEVFKFVVAAMMVDDVPAIETAPVGKIRQGYVGQRLRTVAYILGHGLPMAVPAITYLVMNMVSFKALELIDATVMTMISQLKTLSTALFAQLVLGRRLAGAQWRAIMQLTIAVVIITYARSLSTVSASVASGESAEGGLLGFLARKDMSFAIGVGLMLLEITLSGWISVYFEKHLKDGSFSVWGRNLQLSGASIILYLAIGFADTILAAMREDDSLARSGNISQGGVTKPLGLITGSGDAWSIFAGWSFISVLLVILGAGGGLLVAFSIKHADAVMKSMATAFSLVLVVVIEMTCMGASADPVVCLASASALVALQTYQDASVAAAAAATKEALPRPEPCTHVSTATEVEAT
eukprot:CAMPEP_0180569342 /NCGR_PEP_ID=MMETSP1037_2-20121125/7629_1 /TAXON_ID=632150 /ORGANISM="Azadinium spinosum, Strain 3D9" /LENGTH=394 /DNA_ID=CAMNT_0022586575 /DNA_START=1 /DNA_END=1181 /DNA_ORIENTATION=-